MPVMSAIRLGYEGRPMPPHRPLKVTPLFSYQTEWVTRVDPRPSQGPAESGGKQVAPS